MCWFYISSKVLFYSLSRSSSWRWISRDPRTLLIKNWCSETRMNVLSYWMEPWHVPACSARAESFFLFSNTAFWCCFNRVLSLPLSLPHIVCHTNKESCNTLTVGWLMICSFGIRWIENLALIWMSPWYQRSWKVFSPYLLKPGRYSVLKLIVIFHFSRLTRFIVVNDLVHVIITIFNKHRFKKKG